MFCLMFILFLASNVHISDFPIIPRSFWSIKKPKEEYDKIQEPVKLVIICMS